MSNNNSVVVMNQLANATATSVGEAVQTPLEHLRDALNRQPKSGKKSSVSLTESALCGLLVIRANDTCKDVSEALQKIAGVELPDTLSSAENGEYCVRWMTPDEWLLSCPNANVFELENSLRASVDGHFALVNVSGGYSVLTLSGADARNILKKSCVYDLNPENFAPGKVVNTLLAKSQVTIRALADDAFEIIVRRSFADYVWLWLQRAGKEYNIQLALLDS